ncbi:MAG TPA: tail fiber domain-containing protein, partial [Candidatus Dormibacteraeota bacterium]|nr:tail fiber domain-containing protein [Candidatus Dormibacteraeota bacterium]
AIRAGAVTETSLADGAVTTAKLDPSIGVWTRSGTNVYRPAGNVGIGIPTPNEKLEVDGYVRSKGYATRAGTGGGYTSHIFNFDWTGSALQAWVDGVNVGTVSLTSDRRLKEEIQPMPETALARVLSLRPVAFRYKDIGNSIFSGNGQTQEGFVADELQQVIPSAVNGEGDARTSDGQVQPQTVNLMPLVSVLTKAVQEIAAQKSPKEEALQELNRKLEEQKMENEALKARLEKLEKLLNEKSGGTK